MQQNLLSCKQSINVLQREMSGFRVAEVDQRQEAEVEDRKVDIGPPLDVIDADWRDFHHEKGKDPVGGRSEGGSACSNGKGRVFSRHCQRLACGHDRGGPGTYTAMG